jgi:hypothetical protein
MNEPTPQPEENPYLATQVADVASSAPERSQPGTAAIVFSVITGLAVAVLTFGVTFFFTCVGVNSIDGLRSEFGMVIVFVVAGLTTVATFVFTVWGFLKIVRSLKS